jgi:hypothetical protein
VSLTDRAIEMVEQLSEHSLTERERRIVELTAKFILSQEDFLLKLRAANLARNREWDPHGRLTLTFRSTELAGEGLALAWQKRTLVVGWRENVFCCLPQVEFFETWESAKAALTRKGGR